jgi:hypothetical protein
MSQKKLVSSIMEDLRLNLGKDGLTSKKELALFALGTESFDNVSREAALSAKDSLEDTISRTIKTVLSKEEFKGTKFSPAQISAAKAIASLAMDPQLAMESLKNLRDPEVKGAFQVDGLMLGVEDMLDPMTLAVEAFDGQSVSNAIFFSIATTLLSTTQDTFGETFYPTLMIDPTVSGIAIETEFTSLYTSFERSIAGTADKKKFNKAPLMKAIYDNNLFTADRNKVVPVLRDESKDSMLEEFSHVDVTAGEDITTAPLKFGQEVGLLGVSQTASLLAKGVFDETDVLDRTINLENIYFSLAYDDNGTPKSEMFKFNASMFPHANFTYAPQGHMKKMMLDFETEYVYVNTTTTKTAKNTVSTVLESLADNHSIQLKIKVVGDANTAYGDVSIHGVVAEVVAIRDSSNTLLVPTSATSIAIKAAFASIKLEGYTLEAYRTNSNLRSKGDTITSDRETTIYSVPLRSGITVVTPINNNVGSDNDSKLTSQIQMLGMRVSKHAVQELVKTSEMLRSVTANGASAPELLGVGRAFVHTHYSETTIELINHVDSLSSNQRTADIKAALVNVLRDQVLKMALESNYLVAHQAINGVVGKKISVIVGTNPRIHQYLTSGDEISIGEEYTVKVVSTPNLLVGERMFITFSVFDEDRNTKVNPLSYGNCLWAPTITTDVSRTANGSIVRELHTIPRYTHIMNCPIMSVINVSDIEGVLGKVRLNMRAI